MQVKFIHCTPNAENIIAYCARVSSPNQDNPKYDKLLKYLIEHKHWSPFELAGLCLEITTTRSVSAQILRHKSFSFQEMSQRYSEAIDYETYPARSQDLKNRQNSIDNMSEDDKIWFRNAQEDVWSHSKTLYDRSIHRGVAKELARVLLPLNTTTKLYVHGTIRSWIHYLLLRTDKDTQLEHRLIAEECKKIFIEQFPTIAKALEWV